MNKEIDDVDKKIVNLLLFDADITNREIASKCKIALGTVNNRIKRLKKLGVIKKKTIVKMPVRTLPILNLLLRVKTASVMIPDKGSTNTIGAYIRRPKSSGHIL